MGHVCTSQVNTTCHSHASKVPQWPLVQMQPSLYCFFLCGKGTQASLHNWFLDHFSGNLLFFSCLYNRSCLSSSLAPLWRSWVSTDQQRDGLQTWPEGAHGREGRSEDEAVLTGRGDTGKKEGELMEHTSTKTRRVQG